MNVTDSASTPVTAGSNTANVTVNGALSVTISPGTVTMDVGQSQTFLATVSGGTSSFSYQWYLDGVAVSGATGASWTYTPSAAGSYTVYVIVTDSASTPTSAASNTAQVIVDPQLTASVHPSSATIYLSQSQDFTALPSGGTSPYSYQWYQNSTLVSGATSSLWTFTPTSIGVYLIYVKVTDNVSEVAVSTNAQLTVNPKPKILVTVSPTGAVIDLTQSVAFTSNVTGGLPPFSYQWCLNGSAVSGATSQAWTFKPNSTGYYQVYLNVTDSLNTKAESNIALVAVNSLPSVTISPSPSVVMDVGQSKVFTSTALGGTSPYAYYWYLNSTGVSNTAGSWTYVPSSAGNYTLHLTIIDTTNMIAKSNVVQITVHAALHVSITPTSLTMDVGQSQTFSISSLVGGTSPYSYQWYLDNSPVPSATNVSWTFEPSSAGSYTIYLKVTDAVSATTISNSVPVTVNGPLSVQIWPNTVTLDVGQSKLFNSTVYGGSPSFVYQWYLNGAAIAGGTSWTFTPSLTGSYTVYLNVTDKAGITAKSNTATVKVNSELSVTIAPTAVVMDVGQSQTFTATASGGTSPFSYQWYLDGTSVSDATGSTWTFTPRSGGTYPVYVTVKDNASIDPTAESNTVYVHVNALFKVTISPTSANVILSQSVLFSSNLTGGSPSYHYQWYVNGTAASYATASVWTFYGARKGTYNVYLNVTDSTGATAISNVAEVIVVAASGVGGVSRSAGVFSFLAPWLSVISLMAAAMLLKGVIAKKKRR